MSIPQCSQRGPFSPLPRGSKRERERKRLRVLAAPSSARKGRAPTSHLSGEERRRQQEKRSSVFTWERRRQGENGLERKRLRVSRAGERCAPANMATVNTPPSPKNSSRLLPRHHVGLSRRNLAAHSRAGASCWLPSASRWRRDQRRATRTAARGLVASKRAGGR